MAIREELTLDTSKYRKELDNANRATIKYARKQERLHEQNKKSLKSIETELRRLKTAREASNNPKAVRKYTNTIEKLEKEQRELREETEKYERAVKRSGDQSESTFQKIGRSAKRWIAGVTIGALLAVGEAMRRISAEQMRFDQKMNESLAIMGDVSLQTRQQMEETARSVSSDLNMAVDEAAQSYFYLASAGLDAHESMDALPAVAEFAKAGMFDMATATDLATDAQSALGLTSENSAENLKNLRRVTDVLVNANQDANASVQQFSEALTNKGATALRNVNKEIEEGAGVLAAYADQGIKGRRAGEYLSRTLRIMSQAASKNTEEFKELGIVTAEGNLQDFPTIIEALTEELGGLSDTAMTARLEQMGFTSEVQEAIKPLIGLSDQVREYTESAYEAAGATREVAENQLESFLQKASRLWRSIKNRLAPSFETAMGAIEPLIDTLQDWVDIPLSQELEKERLKLNTLVMQITSANTSQEERNELIDNLQKEYPEFLQNLDAEMVTNEELADRLQEVNEKYADRIVIQKQAEKVAEAVENEADAMERLAEERLSLSEQLSQIVIDQGIDVDLSGMTELERLDAIREELRRTAEFGDAETPFGDPEPLNESAEALLKMRNLGLGVTNAMEELRQAEEQVADVEQRRKDIFEALGIEVDKVKDDLSDGSGGTSGLGVTPTKQELEDLSQFVDYLMQAEALDGPPTARLSKVATLFGDIDQQMQQWAQGDVVGALMRGAASNVERYNQALTEAHNELRSGAITQQEYEEKVKNATDTFLGQVKEIYKSLKDDLTPAQEELFEEWLSNVEDVNEQTGETESSLSDIADTADALINVADAFGQISDQARKSLRGISDVLRNVEQLKNLGEDAGFFQSVMPGIGVAGGIMSIASGLAKGDPRQTELINQLESLERQLRRNTEALREQALVGSDISQAQLSQAEALRDQLENLMEEARESSWGDVGNIAPRIGNVLEELSNMGVEALEGFNQDLFESLLARYDNDPDKIDDVLEEILGGTESFEGLNDVIRMITNNLGQFGESLDGAIERLEMTTQLGGDQDEAFDTFISEVTGLIGQDNEITDLLEQIAEASTEEERKALAEDIWNAFQANPQLIGSDLTGSDLQEIIDVILNQESATGSEAGDGFSRSVQIAKGITSVEANEMIMFLERIEKWTRDTAAGVGSKTAQSVNESGGLMPDLNIPIPLEVKITNNAVPVEVLNSFGSGGGNGGNGDTKNIDIGDINIGRDEISDEEIDEIGRRFTDKLKREIRSSQF